MFDQPSRTGVPAQLRQVEAQSEFHPRPPVNYEVVTPSAVWKISRGKRNFAEAFVIFLKCLQRGSAKDFQAIPAGVRAVVDERSDLSMSGLPTGGRRSTPGFSF